MNIAITGSSGLVGSALTERLTAGGHTVTRVVRSRESATAPDAIYWKPANGEVDAEGVAAQDVVINLAGENIFGLWTPAKKERIHQSRVAGTRLLAETIGGLDVTRRPRLLINASAIGYYGDRPPDQALTEEAEPGESFMAHVVQDWEAATAPAAEAGVRVALTRFGLVLDPSGVLLRGMTLATRLGLGAKIGDGRRPFPWTTRDEIGRVVEFLLADEEVRGPVNVVAPERVTNETFADTVARVLHRPRVLRVPELALRMVGDLGDEMLTGAWVVPEKLAGAGYEWLDPSLEAALRRLLERDQ